MKKAIAVFGAGGLGREVAAMIRQFNINETQWELLGFFDDGLKKGDSIDGHKILGGRVEANAFEKPLSLVLAIADPSIRQDVADYLKNPKLDFPVLRHPWTDCGDVSNNHLGRGVILSSHVSLTTGINLAEFTIVNLGCTIGHDVTLGAFTSVMPGCNISGNVRIGPRCVLGTGSKYLPGLSIGGDSIVGAGAVVTKNFPERSKLIGVPAKQYLADENKLEG